MTESGCTHTGSHTQHRGDRYATKALPLTAGTAESDTEESPLTKKLGGTGLGACRGVETAASRCKLWSGLPSVRRCWHYCITGWELCWDPAVSLLWAGALGILFATSTVGCFIPLYRSKFIVRRRNAARKKKQSLYHLTKNSTECSGTVLS
jgi:hypothetical protein